MGEEFEIPFDVTLSLYRKPDKIKASKYENLLKMDEDEFSDLVDDLEKYAQDLAEDFSKDLSGIEDVFDGMDDLFGGYGGVEDFPVVDEYPEYDYSYGYGF